MNSEKILDQEYWDKQYISNATGWDLGQVSPPIKKYVDNLKDKHINILIPGCGNTYEAEYLLEQGFTNVTVIDIAPTLVKNLQKKFKDNTNISIVLGDFFEHQGSYDLIIEQTFFCALPPLIREEYVSKMYQLLTEKGKLVGLLFNKIFDSGPPFGGTQIEYEQLFKDYFDFKIMENCHNSIAPRANSELFIEFQKK
ncbi:methyltransferase domain-containing protein [Flavobacterium sp.]|uniref:methyltransferase domain-containing protein n=1 Tax=Flavobacterium sp. TaxID=239 RepID=UPI0025BFE269|nr:methyltransferase domain-containing protein [Flavobacterium sp.]MBA4275855.1 SAM-dependent methyltransferase [Flavobacterium sp.]